MFATEREKADWKRIADPSKPFPPWHWRHEAPWALDDRGTSRRRWNPQASCSKTRHATGWPRLRARTLRSIPDPPRRKASPASRDPSGSDSLGSIPRLLLHLTHIVYREKVRLPRVIGQQVHQEEVLRNPPSLPGASRDTPGPARYCETQRTIQRKSGALGFAHLHRRPLDGM